MAPGPAATTWQVIDGFKLTTGEKYTAEEQKIFQDEGFKEYFVDFSLELPYFEKLLNAMYAQVSHLCLYMHSDKDEFVGFARSAIRGKRIWVAGFAIVPAFRGKGIGPVLMKEYLNLLRERSYGDSVQLECIKENIPAHKLYLRTGFKDTFELWDYDIAVGQTLPDDETALDVTVSDRLDLSLPWLQYRTDYSWQREMSTLLNSANGQKQIVVKQAGTLVVGLAIETTKDPMRIVGFAFEKGSLTSDKLGEAIQAARAAIQNTDKGLQVRLEPDFVETVALLNGLAGCERGTRYEEYNMVLHLDRSESK